MSCCKKHDGGNEGCNTFNNAFIILVLYILLAIILGSRLY